MEAFRHIAPRMPPLLSPSDPDMTTEEWYKSVLWGSREAWDNPLAKAYLIGWPYPVVQLRRSAALAFCNENAHLKKHTDESVKMVLDLATLFWKEEREVSWMLEYLGRMTEKRGLGSSCHRVLIHAACLMALDHPGLNKNEELPGEDVEEKINALKKAAEWASRSDTSPFDESIRPGLVAVGPGSAPIVYRAATVVASAREYVRYRCWMFTRDPGGWADKIRGISPELPTLWKRTNPSL